MELKVLLIPALIVLAFILSAFWFAMVFLALVITPALMIVLLFYICYKLYSSDINFFGK